ncbi:hypothetical protein E2C01_012767 [Portunus trituberculatus]|uniref:Uncharacterized protein n=1 Tax=Portunus trituberculatus TaxID=210409 RepID=A0A5B7DF48_PORTR|nr:hypothetical protein [Portunus trituberculatus]
MPAPPRQPLSPESIYNVSDGDAITPSHIAEDQNTLHSTGISSLPLATRLIPCLFLPLTFLSPPRKGTPITRPPDSGGQTRLGGLPPGRRLQASVVWPVRSESKLHRLPRGSGWQGWDGME